MTATIIDATDRFEEVRKANDVKRAKLALVDSLKRSIHEPQFEPGTCWELSDGDTAA